MTSIISSVDAAAVSDKLLPPVSRGLEAIYLLGGGSARAHKNFALGKPNGRLVGSPVAGSGYMQLTSRLNYIQTETEEPEHGTYLVAARAVSDMATDGTRPMYFGTFQSPAAGGGGNTYGLSLVPVSATNATAYASRGTSIDDDTTLAASIADTATTTWALYSIVVSPNQTILRDHTQGLIGVRNTSVPRFRSTGKFRIGSAYQTYGGICDVAYWQAHSSILTDDELAKTVDFVRAMLARSGISV